MLKFIKKTLEFTYFLFNLIKNKSFRNNIKKNYSGNVILLANGPSLKEVIPNLEDGESFKNVDFMVLNYFANESVFFKIKPTHYFLADPMFFRETDRMEAAKKMYKILDTKVDWDMNLYIPKSSYPFFLKFSQLNNKKINIVTLNTVPYMGYEKFRSFYYKKGLCMPRVGTVANMAIFAGINLGYSSIDLYGVDHTFLSSLMVNKNNVLCNKIEHFYDNISKIVPVLDKITLKPIPISVYLKSINLMFESHDLLSAYAKKSGVSITNYTECSLIDSYDRF